MTEEILTLALQLGGQAGDEEILRPLCQAAEVELTSRLRSGAVPSDCGGIFPLAAAYWALAGLCAAGRQDAVESFTAGEVTVHHSSGGTAAERCSALRNQALWLLAPWAQDGGFCFQQVTG